jgi:glycosyltransferase involved in cell wall biosynthesis
MSVVFFHQNEVLGAQGGIERYLATLLDQAGDSGFLVTGASSSGDLQESSDTRFGVPLPLRNIVPKWLSYALGMMLSSRRVGRAIDRLRPRTLEFSRPHYVVFSWMFTGTKVFTLHGTGPPRSEKANYWAHYFSCLLLPIAADVVQVVGRDHSGLPLLTARLMAKRLRHVDAWYDEVFRITPFRNPAGPLRVFFAGRLAPMKNPELLFNIIETASRRFDSRFEFRYFGADEDKIPVSLRQTLISSGLLNAEQLARAIADCHTGLLCSGYGEGSPFIVVEALACGRGFVLPPLPGLIEAYQNCRGIVLTSTHSVEAYIDALVRMDGAIKGGLTPQLIAQDVSNRSATVMARQILEHLEGDRC